MPRLTLHMQCEIRVTDDAASAYAERATVSGLDAAELRASPYVVYGGLDTIHDRLVELRERYGISYVRVSEDEIVRLAPLVARLRDS